MNDLVTLKDVFYLIIGTAIGLLLGIGIYWMPLGQFKNEMMALWNLTRFRPKRGDAVTIKPGTDFKPVDSSLPPKICTSELEASVWHDEGVTWHFRPQGGWVRARVFHIYVGSEPALYRVCHLDLVKK